MFPGDILCDACADVFDSDSIRREHSSLTAERERQNTAFRMHDRSLSDLRVQLGEIQGKLTQKVAKEAQIKEMQQEIDNARVTLEVWVPFATH